MRYFCYCPVEGFGTYETEKEAKDAAIESLKEQSDNASEGWDPDVESICWGELSQHIVKTKDITT